MTSVDSTPTYNDIQIATLVYRALVAIGDAGRIGDRKVFISALWAMMVALDAETGSRWTEGATLDNFKGWLLYARRLTRDGRPGGAPLVVLARADYVAAMDLAMVAASESITDGAVFHFMLDPATTPEAYAPRRPIAALTRTRGCVGAAHRTV